MPRFKNVMQKSKLIISLINIVTVILLFGLTVSPLGVFAQQTKKSDASGSCGDGYQKLSVGIGSNGEDCVQINSQDPNNNPIYTYLRAIIRFVAAGVGLGLVLLVVIAGIRWTLSQGNPQAIAAALKLLVSAVVGLIAFVLLFAILNYLIPGNLIGP